MHLAHSDAWRLRAPPLERHATNRRPVVQCTHRKSFYDFIGSQCINGSLYDRVYSVRVSGVWVYAEFKRCAPTAHRQRQRRSGFFRVSSKGVVIPHLQTESDKFHKVQGSLSQCCRCRWWQGARDTGSQHEGPGRLQVNPSNAEI